MASYQSDNGPVPVDIIEQDDDLTKVALRDDTPPLGDAGEESWVDTEYVTLDGFETFRNTDVALKTALQARVADDEWDGDAVEFTLAPGVTFLWDTWSDPVITIWDDSPYHVEDADVVHLEDYGEAGDDLATFVNDIFEEVDSRRVPSVWEFDNRDAHTFFSHGVMLDQH